MPASALLNNTRVASASARGRLSTHCRNLRGSEGKPGGNATGSALGNAMNAAWIRLMRQLSPEYALLAGSTLARHAGQPHPRVCHGYRSHPHSQPIAADRTSVV